MGEGSEGPLALPRPALSLLQVSKVTGGPVARGMTLTAMVAGPVTANDSDEPAWEGAGWRVEGGKAEDA